MLFDDTIAAISTAIGEGSIAVIRVSGSESVAIVDRIFRGKQKLAEVESHTVHYGFIIDPQNGQSIDEVLVTIMRAPRSFTTEDVVEVSCHGGIISVRYILELLLTHGARLAEPGEFTKRAFLSGRIDLAQAEAVIDLIRSKSDRAFDIALRQSKGMLSEQIRTVRHQLVELMAHIEVNIDYPEHDVEQLTSAFIREKSTQIIIQIERLLATAQQGKVLREGIVTAIVGRPNVGKSSLLNVLAQDNRAIVTDIPGTTRDVIEETVSVAGIPLVLLDTAGIRETSDLVEQIGVERSHHAIAQADLILLVLNQNEPLLEEEHKLLQQLQDRPVIILLNKTDLPARLDGSVLEKLYPADRIVHTSMTELAGIESLERAISSIFFQGELEGADPTYVSNVRHIHLLQQALACIQDAIHSVDAHIPIDLIQIDIRSAWEHLGEIIGETAAETLLEQIFSQFCLGK